MQTQIKFISSYFNFANVFASFYELIKIRVLSSTFGIFNGTIFREMKRQAMQVP